MAGQADPDRILSQPKGRECIECMQRPCIETGSVPLWLFNWQDLHPTIGTVLRCLLAYDTVASCRYTLAYSLASCDM